MCGIAGYLGAEADAGDRAIGAMTGNMARRGPDGEGVARWPGAVLGHRRLAIIDLSAAGHQPMLSGDKQIGIAFNGCIYNFQDLRRELEALGHRFRSQCDTEVLVRGYEAWGTDELVRRIRGMFAFALWDNRRRCLTLVRDRLGVKPVVYAARGSEFAFASTVGALRAAGFGGGIDPRAVSDYLEFGFVTERHAIYEGIAKLPPATILEWQDGHVTQRKYWDLPDAMLGTLKISFEDAVAETERLLVEAVRKRLIADVPLGVLLSGGIDSALVCWALRELNADVAAYTVKAGNDPEDESAAAASTARALGIRHETVTMPASGGAVDELVEAWSEPFSCQSAQGLLWVSRAVKQRATVLLTGDGGDDIFLGYPFFRNALTAERIARRIPAGMAAQWKHVRGLLPAIGPVRRLRSLLDAATGGEGGFARLHDGLPYYRETGLLGERMDGVEQCERTIPGSHASARRLLADVFDRHRRLHFTSEFMPKVDGATMYFSIEARAPFLDQELWEFAAQLPVGIRLRQGELKAPLREIVRRRIGHEVASRKKQGFTVPAERWLASRWSAMLDPLRGETLLEREGWVARGRLGAAVARGIERGEVPVQIWRLLVLEHWLARNPHGSAGRSASSGSGK